MNTYIHCILSIMYTELRSSTKIFIRARNYRMAHKSVNRELPAVTHKKIVSPKTCKNILVN